SGPSGRKSFFPCTLYLLKIPPSSPTYWMLYRKFPSAEACKRAVRCDLMCIPWSKTLMDTFGSLACAVVTLYTMVPPLPSPASASITAPDAVIHRPSLSGGVVPGPSFLLQPASVRDVTATPSKAVLIGCTFMLIKYLHLEIIDE